ncbi:hypothetical protein NDU88_004951 [Pleurodeles waltl]|uniref:Uncharacterized protein n=1 Tax=Pleurodeles waltl TaxID=8319 RepID=A0AAV7PI70_PLEWA|nr:hypothetical protein NDU88_004951 [Pleurodeles waltl]
MERGRAAKYVFIESSNMSADQPDPRQGRRYNHYQQSYIETHLEEMRFSNESLDHSDEEISAPSRQIYGSFISCHIRLKLPLPRYRYVDVLTLRARERKTTLKSSEVCFRNEGI